MFFSREGNKSKYSREIIKHFPTHTTYVEPFVGIGGVFFNKPLAKYNLLNDNSKFIYSIYSILKSEENIDKMIKTIEFTPNYFEWINDNIPEPILTILRTAYSLYGSGKTQYLGNSNSKINIINKLHSLKNIFLDYCNESVICNKDVFSFLNSISFRPEETPDKCLIYSDPPYCISKGSLKDNQGWNINRLEQLILQLAKMKVMFAISEFNDLEVVNLFNKYNLQINTISKSKFTLTNEKYEILATNYNIADNLKQIDLF